MMSIYHKRKFEHPRPTAQEDSYIYIVLPHYYLGITWLQSWYLFTKIFMDLFFIIILTFLFVFVFKNHLFSS